MASGNWRYSLECSPLGYSKCPSRSAPVSRRIWTTSSWVGSKCILYGSSPRGGPVYTEGLAGPDPGCGKGYSMSTTRRGFLTAAGVVGAHDMAHAEKHKHDHDHQALPSDLTLRVKALESLLVEKGLVDRAALDAIVDTYEHKVGPHIGARIVARAWVDAEYKRRLLTDADAAITELGMGGQEGQSMRVVENTPKVHNVVVCTLCSCYPWSVLGLPPVWYKSTAYRARAVIDPRAVLREFGLEVAEEVQVQVWDSKAVLRYLVLPERPPGTEHLSENELAALVTRDSMIGTRKVNSPGSSSGPRGKS